MSTVPCTGTQDSCSTQSTRHAVLYKRHDQYIPRIAAVHDMCGYGKCSLTVAIPVLSAGGCDVCPVPTALFSAHTKYPVFTYHSTTSMLDEYLDAWQAEDVALDGVYSGFLDSPEQVALIKRLYREYPDVLRIVDPVMGDGGAIYPTYTPELCEAMGALANGADILTPNLTEAAILTGIPYAGQNPDDNLVDRLISALLALGSSHVILKGIDRNDGTLRNYVAGQDGTVVCLCHDKLPYMLHGTGDLFCSALTAAVFAGNSIVEAAQFAGEFVRSAMEITLKQPNYEMRGISFEPLLGEVARLLP